MTKEEVIERFTVMLAFNEMLPSVEIEALETAISMLQNATIWTPCTERMPTVEDVGGNPRGLVNVKLVDGTVNIMPVEQVSLWKLVFAWSRIEPKGGGNG